MDIVQRLRCVLKGVPDAQAAADEIESLRQQLAERDKQIEDRNSAMLEMTLDLRKKNAQIAMLREDLGYIVCSQQHDEAFSIAKTALAATDASDWLRKHDAELVRRVARGDFDSFASSTLHNIADQIEKGEWK